YTGTRIGVTTAKTLAWTLQIPIIPISSLKILAANACHVNGYICPFFDARRKTVFTALYKWNDGKLIEVKPETNISMESWLEELKQLEMPVLFLSPDMNTFISIINNTLSNAMTPEQSNLHILRPSNLFMLEEQEEHIPVHKVVPN